MPVPTKAFTNNAPDTIALNRIARELARNGHTQPG